MLFSYNLASFELKYENDTTVTNNVFNGANIRCSANFSHGEIFYAINTPDNFQNVKQFCEHEFSAHADLDLYLNGLVFKFDHRTLRDYEDIKNEKDDTHRIKVQLVDLQPNSNSNVTFILNENKEANNEMIMTCLYNVKNGIVPNMANSTLPELPPANTTLITNNETLPANSSVIAPTSSNLENANTTTTNTTEPANITTPLPASTTTNATATTSTPIVSTTNSTTSATNSTRIGESNIESEFVSNYNNKEKEIKETKEDKTANTNNDTINIENKDNKYNKENQQSLPKKEQKEEENTSNNEKETAPKSFLKQE